MKLVMGLTAPHIGLFHGTTVSAFKYSEESVKCQNAMEGPVDSTDFVSNVLFLIVSMKIHHQD